MTSKSQISCIIDTDGLTLNFADGAVITLGVNDLSDEIIRYATLHGLKQKLIDAAAISRNPDTGRSASLEDKFNAIMDVRERLLAGQWNKGREGGAGGTGGLLFRALCQLYPQKLPEQIREFLEGKSKAEQAALRATPKIAAIIEQLRAKAGSDIDTDELLGDLED